MEGYPLTNAAGYFAVFPHLLTNHDPAITISGRSRRPPLDPVNALLSFLYALLMHDCRSALESCGLDPQCGFLHRDRPGRPSLALDLMEEFRAFLADRPAKTCLDFGQRVQNSVFECKVDPAQLVALKARLLDIIDPKTDSLRFYHLGSNWHHKVEHHGANDGYDVEGTLVV